MLVQSHVAILIELNLVWIEDLRVVCSLRRVNPTLAQLASRAPEVARRDELAVAVVILGVVPSVGSLGRLGVLQACAIEELGHFTRLLVNAFFFR